MSWVPKEATQARQLSSSSSVAVGSDNDDGVELSDDCRKTSGDAVAVTQGTRHALARARANLRAAAVHADVDCQDSDNEDSDDSDDSGDQGKSGPKYLLPRPETEQEFVPNSTSDGADMLSIGIVDVHSTSSAYASHMQTQLDDTVSCRVGDKMVIIKEGSTMIGCVVTVLDPYWNGMIKVENHGKIRSYTRGDLKSHDPEDPEGYATVDINNKNPRRACTQDRPTLPNSRWQARVVPVVLAIQIESARGGLTLMAVLPCCGVQTIAPLSPTVAKPHDIERLSHWTLDSLSLTTTLCANYLSPCQLPAHSTHYDAVKARQLKTLLLAYRLS